MTRDDSPNVDTAARAAWEQTLADAEDLVERRNKAGWDVLFTQAGETTLEVDTDGGGPVFSHLVPDDDADVIAEWVTEGSFPQYDVHRAQEAGTVFLVVELLDPDQERCLLLAAAYSLADVAGIHESAAQDTTLTTRLRRLDTTTVASFKHDESEKFLPTDAGGRTGRRG
jgi:hypothetical protein